jgi:transcription elongation factor Elf1
MTDYPCPECGYDGPHTLQETRTDGIKVIECGSCYCEFEVPADESDE